MANSQLVSPQGMIVNIIPANATGVVPPTAAGGRYPGVMQQQAGLPFLQSITVPGSQLWQIENVFNAPGEGNFNGALEIVVDGTPQIYTPPLFATNINLQKPLALPRTIMIEQAGQLTVNFIPSVTISSSSTVACHLRVMRFPLRVTS